MTRLIDADALLEAIVKNGIYQDAREINNAIANAPTVQREGLVSVPIEPTEEMLDETQRLLGLNKSLILRIYKVMLLAAPTDTE